MTFQTEALQQNVYKQGRSSLMSILIKIILTKPPSIKHLILNPRKIYCRIIMSKIVVLRDRAVFTRMSKEIRVDFVFALLR